MTNMSIDAFNYSNSDLWKLHAARWHGFITRDVVDSLADTAQFFLGLNHEQIVIVRELYPEGWLFDLSVEDIAELDSLFANVEIARLAQQDSQE